jgi:integrase
MLANLERKAELQKAGLHNPYEEHAAAPIADHLETWEGHMQDKGGSAKHALTTANHARFIVQACGWGALSDVDADEALGAVARLPAIGQRTRNYYLRDLQAFTRWAVKRRRLQADPLSDLSLQKVTEVRHGRRALTADQLRAILSAAAGSAVKAQGLAGPDRYHVYLCAMGTGFRAGELGRLTPAAFALDADPPTVTCSASYSKNRKCSIQPLAPDVAAAMRVYLEGREPGTLIWPGTWWQRAAEMLCVDLEVAGVPYSIPGPDGPLFADFHAIRHSYITLLVRSGANVKDVQTLARHSTVQLTLGVYSHSGLADRAAAVNNLPNLSGTKPTPTGIPCCCAPAVA